MDWLKKLQERYKAGKITKEQYEAKLAEGLEDEVISQDEHDKAQGFDPKASDSDDEKIYSQEDMDRMAVNVARRHIRKAFKDAGVDLDVDNKGLLAHVVDLVKNKGEGGGEIDKAELERLRKADGKVKGMEGKLQDLALENAILRSAGQYKPVNANQVVRALRDYSDEIEYDENGVPDKRSLDIVMRRLAKAEPNLFEAASGSSTEDDDKGQQGGEQEKGGFQGKPPGGGAGSGGNATKSKEDKAVADALARMGVKTEAGK